MKFLFLEFLILGFGERNCGVRTCDFIVRVCSFLKKFGVLECGANSVEAWRVALKDCGLELGATSDLTINCAVEVGFHSF